MSGKALVVLSGGQDSTTCLFWARQHFDEIHALTFDYGQKHAIETDAAAKIANMAQVKSHEILTIDGKSVMLFPSGELGGGVVSGKYNTILAGTSPLTNKEEKLEQYDHWKKLPGGLEKTFVPGRNILFLTIAGNRAYVLGCDAVVTGICQEDFGGYPDCRDIFRKHMELALQHGLDRGLRVLAPLMHLTKAESVKMAYDFPGCWEALAYSHTSYDGAYPPTGHDHATLLRAKGFEQAGLPDPLIVRAWHEGLMELPATSNYDGIRKMGAQQ